MVTQQAGGGAEAFWAIADPTRRAILDLLREQELRAGELATHFPVSRPAIAKHVAVLKRAGLLHERRESTARLYSLHPDALAAVDRWLAPYRLYWAARLVDLKRVVEADLAAGPASDFAPESRATKKSQKPTKKSQKPTKESQR